MSTEVETNSESGATVEQSPGSAVFFFAVIFYLIGIALAGYGLFVAFQDLNWENKIVGGDAYNYIIFSGRGAVIVGAGIVSSIVGLACQIHGHLDALKFRLSPDNR